MSSDRPNGNSLHVSKWACAVVPKANRQRNGSVSTIVVHADVWALARILADEDNSRIIHRTPTSVVVRNP